MKKIVHEIKLFLKGSVIAFSMYSKIPMPQLRWKDEYMKYAICFFPLVGVIIGILVYGWFILTEQLYPVSNLTRVCIAAVIPLVVTGGIHIDGFMDTCDALHSYQAKERKLEILKDAHIGAFAVIMLLLYVVSGLGILDMVQTKVQFKLLAGSFVLARILSGFSVVSFPCAKKEGTLYTFSSGAHKKVVQIILLLEMFLCICYLIWQHFCAGSVTAISALLTFFLYDRKSRKEFGGITGDLAGWFLCICEWISCFVIGVLGSI